MLLYTGLVRAEPSDVTSAKHLGVESCATSTCHGSSLPFTDSNVLRNEFRTWNEQDPHARAYQTLLSSESHDIAKKLGLASAENAAVCLGCHSDNIAAERHGQKFKLVDGVGCEACHGGAENYLDSHTSATHQENLEAGLRATENPTVRAKLCVSCHIGNDADRKITHTMMGAGHPRMSFELNTFSGIQPAHYQIDEDYIARKGDHSELQVWAIGQLVASQQILSNTQKFPRSGLFPELVHMDCLGCHQVMSKIDWVADPMTKLKPGSLRYNDAHLIMSYQLAKTLSTSLASDMLVNARAFLNNGVTQTNTNELIAKLQNDIKTIRLRLEGAPLSRAQGKDVLNNLIEHGLKVGHQGYATAEQSAMAINSLARIIYAKQSSGAPRQALLSGIATMFASLNDAERYRAKAFLGGLREIQTALNALD